MILRQFHGRVLPTLGALLASIVAVSCDKSNDVVLSSSLVAHFLPANTNPPGGSFSMQRGNEADDRFQVRIAATGLNDVYRAEFHVTFDPTSVAFLSAIDTNSFLRDGGAQASFQVQSGPGDISVVATRLPFPAGTAVTFTASSPVPAQASVTMQPGAVFSDNTFEVRIAVTGVSDCFGTAFHVTYNPTSVAFVSADDSTSFLRDAGAQTRFQYLSSPGDLAVAATRLQNASGTVPGVNVTGSRDLLVLTFRATAATASNPFAFAGSREVINSGPAPNNQIGGVTYSAGTLAASFTVGVNVTGSRDLIVLVFEATRPTDASGNAFAFGPVRNVFNAQAPPGNQISVGNFFGGRVVTQ